MLSKTELASFHEHLATAQAAGTSYQSASKTLESNYAQLLEEYRRLRSDYEEERENREKYKKLARGQETNTFVLVLVDGDGYVFDESFVRDHAKGGRRAANLLKASLEGQLHHCGCADSQLVVQIYSNLHGLNGALARAGGLGNNGRSLAPFVASFNGTQSLFDYTASGDGKEDTAVKIREKFRLFVDNSQCKHIFFAGCHDEGYIPLLAPYRGRSDRITLIRGASFRPLYSTLETGIIDLPGVFRSQPLERDNVHQPPRGLQPEGSTATQGSVCQFFLVNGRCKHGTSCKFAHVNRGSHPSNGSSSGPFCEAPHRRESRSIVKQDTVHPADVLPLYNKNSTDVSIPVNRNGDRLDFYLPPPSETERGAYGARAKICQPCNDFHHLGHCKKGSSCRFDHGFLSEGAKYVLRVRVHDLPCNRGSACRRKQCAYGHICWRVDCAGQRTGKGCKLHREMHGIDPKVARWETPVPEYEPAFGTEHEGNRETALLSRGQGSVNGMRTSRAINEDVFGIFGFDGGFDEDSTAGEPTRTSASIEEATKVSGMYGTGTDSSTTESSESGAEEGVLSPISIGSTM